MKNYFTKLISNNPRFKKFTGVFLVVFGFVGLVTPFTPWGILFFVGLEMLGVRFIFFDKIKNKLKRKK